MKRLSLSVLAVITLLLSPAVANAQQPWYQNSALPVEERVKDLLGRMTLEEKAAQMQSTWQTRGYPQLESAYFIDAYAKLDVTKAKAILNNGLGEFSRPNAADQQLALRAAHEAITRLKNQNNLLPLNLGTTQRIAVIVANAAEVIAVLQSRDEKGGRTGNLQCDGWSSFGRIAGGGARGNAVAGAHIHEE